MVRLAAAEIASHSLRDEMVLLAPSTTYVHKSVSESKCWLAIYGERHVGAEFDFTHAGRLFYGVSPRVAVLHKFGRVRDLLYAALSESEESLVRAGLHLDI